MKRVECTAKGRVQGVGYRLFVLGKANACQVKGWVRNESDGTVRIAAEANERELKEFVRLIKESKFLQRIESLSVDWCEARGEFDSFNIKY